MYQLPDIRILPGKHLQNPFLQAFPLFPMQAFFLPDTNITYPARLVFFLPKILHKQKLATRFVIPDITGHGPDLRDKQLLPVLVSLPPDCDIGQWQPGLVIHDVRLHVPRHVAKKLTNRKRNKRNITKSDLLPNKGSTFTRLINKKWK